MGKGTDAAATSSSSSKKRENPVVGHVNIIRKVLESAAIFGQEASENLWSLLLRNKLSEEHRKELFDLASSSPVADLLANIRNIEKKVSLLVPNPDFPRGDKLASQAALQNGTYPHQIVLASEYKVKKGKNKGKRSGSTENKYAPVAHLLSSPEKPKPLAIFFEFTNEIKKISSEKLSKEEISALFRDKTKYADIHTRIEAEKKKRDEERDRWQKEADAALEAYEAAAATANASA